MYFLTHSPATGGCRRRKGIMKRFLLLAGLIRPLCAMTQCRLLTAALLTAGLFTIRPAMADITSGLIAYYPFDGNANDASGNGNNGSANGQFASAVIGQGYAFSPGTSFQAPSSPAIQSLTQMSIATWCYLSTVNDNEYIVGKGDDWNGICSYRLWVYGVLSFNFGILTSTGERFIAAQPPGISVLNHWHHLVGVYDGANVTLYVDGVAGTSLPASGTVDTRSSDPLLINEHTWDGSSSSRLGGIVDDVRIYNRALSAVDVAELYNYKGATHTVSIPTTLVGPTSTYVQVANYYTSPVRPVLRETPFNTALIGVTVLL